MGTGLALSPFFFFSGESFGRGAAGWKKLCQALFFRLIKINLNNIIETWKIFYLMRLHV